MTSPDSRGSFRPPNVARSLLTPEEVAERQAAQAARKIVAQRLGVAPPPPHDSPSPCLSAPYDSLAGDLAEFERLEAEDRIPGVTDPHALSYSTWKYRLEPLEASLKASPNTPLQTSEIKEALPLIGLRGEWRYTSRPAKVGQLAVQALERTFTDADPLVLGLGIQPPRVDEQQATISLAGTSEDYTGVVIEAPRPLITDDLLLAIKIEDRLAIGSAQETSLLRFPPFNK